MIRPKLSVCAQDVLRDGETNNVTVVNIYEGFSVEGFPFILSGFAFLVLLERDADDAAQHAGHFELRLGENNLVNGSLKINFEDKLRARHILKVAGLVITAPGIMTARLYLADKLMTEYSFQIDRTTVAPQAQIISTPAH